MTDIIANSALSNEQPVPQPTMEQISQMLNEWLQERGVVLEIVAIGKRTGQPCAIDDFMPDTHILSVTLARIKK